MVGAVVTTVTCEQKITLGEMRAAGVRGILVCCTDIISAYAEISPINGPMNFRLSDLEPLFTCQAYGLKV
jgi:hypothetical protein